MQVGDVVSIKHPMAAGVRAVKRVVGMPGDFVMMDTPGSGSDKMIQVIKAVECRVGLFTKRVGVLIFFLSRSLKVTAGLLGITYLNRETRGYMALYP